MPGRVLREIYTVSNIDSEPVIQSTIAHHLALQLLARLSNEAFKEECECTRYRFSRIYPIQSTFSSCVCDALSSVTHYSLSFPFTPRPTVINLSLSTCSDFPCFEGCCCAGRGVSRRRLRLIMDPCSSFRAGSGVPSAWRAKYRTCFF